MEVGVVRLSKENIELKSKLELAEKEIDELRTKVSQGTVHVYKQSMKPQPRSLNDVHPVGRAGLPTDVVDADEYDRLETETESLRQEVASLRLQLANSTNSKAPSPGQGGVGAGAHTSPATKDLSAELAKANRRVEELTQSERKLKTAIVDLNAELERVSALQPPPPSSTSSSAINRQTSDLPPPPPPAADDAAVEAEVARRLEEEMYLVQQRVEGEVVEMTLELQEKVDELQKQLEAAKGRNAELEAELQQTRKDSTRARSTSFSSPGGSSSKLLPLEMMVKQKHADPSSPEQAVVDQATAERNIAVRVKDEALKEAAHIRTELQRKSAQVTELEIEIARLKASQGTKGGSSGSASPSERDGAVGSPAADWQIKQKDTIIAQLQQQLAEVRVAASLEASTNQRSSDLDQLLRDAQAANTALRSQIQSLSLELASSKSKLVVITAERDKALAAGKRAFVDRQNALKDLESAKKVQIDHESMILTLQKKMNEQNLDKVRRCFSEAMTNFEILQDRLQHSQSADETNEILLDVFFEYEHKLLNLNNEVLSLQAIISMKESDLNDDWSRQLFDLQSELEVLRSNLSEQKRTEAELRGVITALGAAERQPGHFHVQAQPIYHAQVSAMPAAPTIVAMPQGKASPPVKK